MEFSGVEFCCFVFFFNRKRDEHTVASKCIPFHQQSELRGKVTVVSLQGKRHGRTPKKYNLMRFMIRPCVCVCVCWQRPLFQKVTSQPTHTDTNANTDTHTKCTSVHMHTAVIKKKCVSVPLSAAHVVITSLHCRCRPTCRSGVNLI